MFKNVKQSISNSFAKILPSLNKAKEKVSNLPRLYNIGKPVDKQLKSLQTVFTDTVPKKIDQAADFKLFKPSAELNIFPEKIATPLKNMPKTYNIPKEGLKIGSQIVGDVVRLGRTLTTPSGKEEFMTSLKRTPETYREGGVLATLNEPAVMVLLTVPDFMTGGGKKEVAEQTLKKVTKEVSENPTFLRKLFSNIGDSLEGILNQREVMMNLRKGRTVIDSVPGGKEIMGKLDNAFNSGEMLIGKNTKALTTFFKDLTDEEAEMALDVYQELQKTGNQKILKASQELKSFFRSYAKMADNVGIQVKTLSGKRKEFIPIKKYLPQRLDLNKLKASPELQNKLATFLYETGQIPDSKIKGVFQKGTGLVKARKFVEALMQDQPVRTAFAELFPNNTLPKRMGNLEFERVLNLPTEIDGEKILVRNKALISDYLAAASKRIAQAKEFGANNEVVMKFKKETAGLPFSKEAVDIVKKELGNDLKSIAEIGTEKMLGKVRFFESVTKLTTAGVSNLSQSTNTITSYGVGPTVRAVVGDLFHRKQSADFAMDAGIAAEAALRDLMRNSFGSVTGRAKILTDIAIPGFKQTEMFNRRVAANAGKLFAMDEFGKLLKNSDNKVAREALEKFGVNVDEALKRGKLAEGDIIKAARKAVETTQFTTRITDLPANWSSSWGKLITQFKNFTYFQGDFITKQVLSPAIDGNYVPLMRYVAAATVLGEFTGDIRAKIRGKERPEDFWERVADNISQAGGAGLPAEFIEAVSRGRNGIEDWIVGPGLGDVFGLLSDSYQAATGNLKPIAKSTVSKIPLMGPYLKSQFFPSESEKKTKVIRKSSPTVNPFSSGLGY